MLKTGFATPPDASLLAVPPHSGSATRDDEAEVCGVLAAESFKNSRFSRAATEKHNASEVDNAPSPAGSGGSNNHEVTVSIVVDAASAQAKEWRGDGPFRKTCKLHSCLPTT